MAEAQQEKKTDWLPAKEYVVTVASAWMDKDAEGNPTPRLGKFGAFEGLALWQARLEGIPQPITFVPEGTPPAAGAKIRLNIRTETVGGKTRWAGFTDPQMEAEKSSKGKSKFGGGGGIGNILQAKAATMGTAAGLAIKIGTGDPVESTIAIYNKLWAAIDRGGSQ